MFCYKCGNKLPDNAAFCNKCGEKIPVIEMQQENISISTNVQSEAVQPTPVTEETSSIQTPQEQTDFVPVSSPDSNPVPVSAESQNRQTDFLETHTNTAQNDFRQYVENYVSQKTGYRSVDELINSSVPITFAWLSYGIPFLLIVILGIIRSKGIGETLLLAVLVSLLVGFCVSQLMASFRRNRASMRSEVVFEEDVDADDFKDFLNQNLSAQFPYFHQWDRLVWKGGIRANSLNESEAHFQQINLGAQFGSHSTILLARVTIGPYQLNHLSGKKSFYFTITNLVAGWADFSFKKYSYTFKVIPIMQAAAEYYLESRKGGKDLGGSGQASQAINAAQSAIFKDSGDESAPIMVTEKKSKAPIIVGAVIVAIVAAVVFFCIKEVDFDFFNNILPSAGNYDTTLTKSLKDKSFSLNYPSDWNKISNPSALAELSSPDGMANFKVVECYYDAFGVFTGSEAQVKKEVNNLHTFVKLWDTKIDGTSAKALTYKTDGLKGDMVVNNYWYYVGDDMFQIICSYEESAKDSYEDVLGAMVSSFLIVGKSNSITVAVSEPVPITATSPSATKPNTPVQTTSTGTPNTTVQTTSTGTPNTTVQTTSTGTPNTPAQTTASKTEPIYSPPSHTESSKPTVTAKPSMVYVPSCDSYNESSAVKRLKDSGFNVKTEYEYDDYTNKGYTIYTEPSGGTRAEEGTTVILHISKGPRPVIVPNFVGLTSDEAYTLARDNNIEITWRYEYSDYVDAGKIISQSINAGTEIEKYSTVILTVSQGVEDKTVEICGRNYSISSTESIYFWKASLTAADWDNIEKLENLTELTLTECGGIDLNRIGKLGKLKKLSLCWDYIRDISPLKNMTNLTSLELAGNNISDLSPLKNLTNLVSLGLSSNNGITDAEVSKILHLIGLTELDLGYTGIHDIKPIVALKNLKYFSFIGNNIPRADVSWFTEQLPDCQIRW